MKKQMLLVVALLTVASAQAMRDPYSSTVKLGVPVSYTEGNPMYNTTKASANVSSDISSSSQALNQVRIGVPAASIHKLPSETSFAY